MAKPLKIALVLFIAGTLVTTAGCQPAEIATPAPATEPLALPTHTPITPTETQPPDPTAVPTADPLEIAFTFRAHNLYNIKDGGPIYSIAWAPDNSLLAMGGNAEIVIWDVKVLNHAAILEGHTAPVLDMGWSPDGSTMASLDIDGILRIWDIASFSERAVIKTGIAYCMDWSPDGNSIAVGTEAGSIQIWNIANNELIAEWNSPIETEIISNDWSPEGSWIATGDSSGFIHIWDASSGEVIKTLDSYADALSSVNDIGWSPDGTMLASGHMDGILRLWNGLTMEAVSTISAHPDGVYKLNWSPDSLLLATGGVEPSAPIWDPKTGNKITGAGTLAQVTSLAWSPNGKMLGVGSSGSESWGFGNKPFTAIWTLGEINTEAGVVYLWIRMK